LQSNETGKRICHTLSQHCHHSAASNSILLVYALMQVLESTWQKSHHHSTAGKYKFLDATHQEIPQLSPLLSKAKFISPNFPMQKKDVRDNTVHHKATGDQDMCPIHQTAALLARIRSYPITEKDLPKTPINTIFCDGILSQIPSSLILETNGQVVKFRGVDNPLVQ
jgi:hypothetical protein